MQLSNNVSTMKISVVTKLLLIVPITLFSLASIACAASEKKDEHKSSGHKIASQPTQKGAIQKPAGYNPSHSSVLEHTPPEKYTSHSSVPEHTTPEKYTSRSTNGSLHRNAGNPKENVIVSSNRPSEWHQAVANRKEFWNGWANENQARVQKFQATRAERYGQISNFWLGKNIAQTFHSDSWFAYRQNVIAFRTDRRLEICNQVRFYHDDLFAAQWWAGCGWSPPVAVVYRNPWWWWAPASWGSLTVFLAWGNPAPIDYDFGVNIVDDGQYVYREGGSPVPIAEETSQVTQLADSQSQVLTPIAPGQDQSGDFDPLGVWSLVQQEHGDATMFLQLSVNKQGAICGAYDNILTGEKAPVSGRVDRATQRVAFRFGNIQNTVIEAGVFDLCQDTASCVVHFGSGNPQTWLLVRLPAPNMPNAPAPTASAN